MLQRKLIITRMDGPKDFHSNVTIVNHTPHIIQNLVIEHRPQNNQKQSNQVEVFNLSPQEKVCCKWNFGIEGPTVFGCVMANILTAGVCNIWKNYGKDYWLLTLKTDHQVKKLTTNCKIFWNFNASKEGDKWWADIAPQDQQITIKIRYDKIDKRYLAAIDRNNKNSQSTRYFRY